MNRLWRTNLRWVRDKDGAHHPLYLSCILPSQDTALENSLSYTQLLGYEHGILTGPLHHGKVLPAAKILRLMRDFEEKNLIAPPPDAPVDTERLQQRLRVIDYAGIPHFTGHPYWEECRLHEQTQKRAAQNAQDALRRKTAARKLKPR